MPAKLNTVITKIKGLCEFEECKAKATHLAVGRFYAVGDDNVNLGHPELGLYCEQHAHEIAEENYPEYVKSCPNCGCVFGVN